MPRTPPLAQESCLSQNSTISLRGEPHEAHVDNAWAGIRGTHCWRRYVWFPAAEGTRTHRMLEVRGHAHAQLHLLHGEIQLFTHLLPQGQQHLQGRREDKRITPPTATPAQLQGLTGHDSCFSLKVPSHATGDAHTSHRSLFCSTITAPGDFLLQAALLTTHQLKSLHTFQRHPAVTPA